MIIYKDLLKCKGIVILEQGKSETINYNKGYISLQKNEKSTEIQK